jgi:hypothetical protein
MHLRRRRSGVERVRAILDADEIIAEKSDALTPATIKGDILGP